MQIEADAVIRFPRPRVFTAYRDKLVDLVPFLPNVRGIKIQERAEEGDALRMFNVWHGGGEIPAPLT